MYGTCGRIDNKADFDFDISCLQRILGVTWRDRVPHTEILKKTNCRSIDHPAPAAVVVARDKDAPMLTAPQSALWPATSWSTFSWGAEEAI